MTTEKKGLLRKKIARLVVSSVVIGIILAMWAFIPAFQSAEYEINDNQLVIERDNMYNTNMDVIVNVIDEKGNVREETVKVYFEDDVTDYTFDQEYFQNALDTEDNVYIIDIDNDLFSSFSNYANPVKTVIIIFFIISLIACFFFMMTIMSFTY